MDSTREWLRIAGCCAALVLAPGPAPAQCMQWSTPWVQPYRDVWCFAVYDDGTGPALYVGGDFDVMWHSTLSYNHIGRWNGSAWSSLGLGLGDTVTALAVYDPGQGAKLYVGGAFAFGAINYIASWNGSSWESVDSGFGSAGYFGAVIRALVVYDDGHGPALYAGGDFIGAGSSNAHHLAKFDGLHWSEVGTGVVGQVYSLCVYDDGHGPALYSAGGFSNFAKWNGTAWTDLSHTSRFPVIASIGQNSMAVFEDGSGLALYVNVVIPSTNHTQIARWNGTSWSEVGILTDVVTNSMTVFDDGSGPALFVGGYGIRWPSGGHYDAVAKWNGRVWSKLGGGIEGLYYEVKALAVYDDGHGPSLYIGGGFQQAAGIQTQTMASWRGCTARVEAMCFGDGSVAVCPCSNQGQAGNGCQNSLQAGGAGLTASGTAGNDTLVLNASGMLPDTLAIFFQGSAFVSGSSPFGDGLTCAGGRLIRLYSKTATAGQAGAPEANDPSIRARAATQGDALPPDSVRYYQVYYRDRSASFCPSPTGSTFNTTNGLRVVW
jgi:hypothetical protein